MIVDLPATPSKPQAHTTSPPPINWSTRPKPCPADSSDNPQDHTEELRTPTHRLVPVLIDIDCLGDLQEILRRLNQPSVPVLIDIDHLGHLQEIFRCLSQPSVPEPRSEFCEETAVDTHNLKHLLRHLGHPKSQRSQPKFREGPCFYGKDPSPEVQDLTSAFSGLSTSTNYARSFSPSTISSPNRPLAARATPDTRLTVPLTNSAQNYSASQIARSLASSVQGHQLVARTVPFLTGTFRQVSPQKKRYYVILVGKSTGIYYDEW